MTPRNYMEAARVPETLQPCEFGKWTIRRDRMPEPDPCGWSRYTLLHRWSFGSLHTLHGEIVMEDSSCELRKHLGLWMVAEGGVLVTGLGLGCVVRGLLAKPAVSRVDVIEIDADILRIVGAEFADDPRVTLHHGDALTLPIRDDARWDFAWHDLWTDGERHLQLLHAEVMVRFRRFCGRQGAWAFPRWSARSLPYQLLGAPRQAAVRASA